MRLIYEEFLNSKDRKAIPNRKIGYVDLNSKLYTDILEEKLDSQSEYGSKTWNKDCSFIIEPLYASLLNRSTNNKECSEHGCLHFLYRILYFQQNNCCILKFKRTNDSVDKETFKSYGSCRFKTCNNYLSTAIKRKNKSYIVDVETTNNKKR